ncbi:hypothetical protein ACI2K4_27955 [Micromonospora sp. NPDC050397]
MMDVLRRISFLPAQHVGKTSNDAIPYAVRIGYSRRRLPGDFPPWPTAN